MNATQTAILESLTKGNSYYTVTEIVAMVGKSETTVRKAIKEMLVNGDVQVDTIDGVKHYTNTPIVPDAGLDNEAYTELMNATAEEDAEIVAELREADSEA